MKTKLFSLCLLFLFFACKETGQKTIPQSDQKSGPKDSFMTKKKEVKIPELSLENANKLAALPLHCLSKEFPNKLGQVLHSTDELARPKELHPAFYGCFDWHSSVHGHWSLVSLLKSHPELEKAAQIKAKLKAHLSPENIAQEVAYFKSDDSYERTYGWAWLLKLAEELHTWDSPMADTLETHLQPLTDLIVKYLKDFLPKLTRPLRVGQHENTAFALVFAYDYAQAVGDRALKELIVSRAKDFYGADKNCPIAYEPGGFSFLSPCLEEVNIMQRVLPEEKFIDWLGGFMPRLFDSDFKLQVGQVTDRGDGKLVHLDGLNFSRAWVFYDLANSFERLKHLKRVGDKHFQHSFEHILHKDSYMGSHWLGSFAIYALNRRTLP